MSAIWGIVAPHIDSQLKSDFNCMTKIMPFSDDDITNVVMTDRSVMGHSTIGTFHKEGYPVSSDNGSSVAICGVPIWEGDGSKNNNIDSEINDSIHDTELVQFALRSNRLADVGGVYAFAEWNPETSELLLGTDRLGFRGVYYFHDEKNNVLYYASRLRGLADVVAQKNGINWRAVLEFLTFGYQLGNKTFYANINLIPPGSVVKYSLRGVSTRRYWDVGSIKIDNSMSYEEAVELNSNALKCAIERRTCRCEKVETIMLLSGGTDSRRIAGELRKQGIEYDTFTTRGFSAEDMEGPLAAEVASALGRTNHFIDLPINGFVEKYWGKSNHLVDYESCLHQWLLPLKENIPKKNIVNYDGIAGDILLDAAQRASSFYSEKEFAKVQGLRLENKIKKLSSDKVNISFLKKNIAEEINNIPSVESSIKEELLKYCESENQLLLFVLMNRTRRSISLAPNRVLQSKIESMFPYLDIDVLKASLSTPLQHRLKHTLRRDIVENSYPELAKIPYTQYKRQLPEYTVDFNKSYTHEKKRQIRFNIIKYFIKNNIAFNFSTVWLKFLVCYFLSLVGVVRVPYEFSLTFQVFYEWLDTYGCKLLNQKDFKELH